MFKKINVLLIIFIFFITICQVNIISGELNNVKDYLDYLTDEEESALQEAIEAVKNDYNLDVVIVITDDTEGKSSMEFADDYYDDNGYGVGSDASGLLMLINMDQREVWISTTGKAIDIFTDSRIAEMIDHVISPLSEGNYFEASNTFIDDIKTYGEMGVPQGQFRVENEPYYKVTYFDKVLRLMKSFYVYLIALMISGIATLFVSLSSKGSVTIDNHTYEGKGSFVLSSSRDDFLRETTTKTRIQTDSGSGGSSSSVHSSSSGTTHGGGGGKF
ncbi:MAG: TPM domain-containing protein [Epulopiscium sp.]|nr:TPM domain-containing protein [Candidatus Epulonipiscium sp.]